MTLNTPKARAVITNFTKDLVELVRESLLEETQNILAAKFEERRLAAPKRPKQLAAKPTRVRIKATPKAPLLTTPDL